MAKSMLLRILVLILTCFAQPLLSATTSRCKGTVEECLASGSTEIEMIWVDPTEMQRRLLGEEKKYISYGALQRNTVPCSRKGASYYNCQPGAEANPYNRGCSAITRCRS